MKEEVILLLRENAPLMSILSFLAGALVGHRFALGRDRRKERIEVFSRVRAVVLSQRGQHSLSAADKDAVMHFVRWWRYRNIPKAIAACDEAARSYYNGKSAIGALIAAPGAEERMNAARAALVRSLHGD